MLKQFENHLSHQFPFLEGKKLLLAVSGGLDSMVLVHLFQQLDYEIVVLHCNFQLRVSSVIPYPAESSSSVYCSISSFVI